MITFSVIVTARNAQGYLRGCLESVLSQSGGDAAPGLEVIGVDHGSTDATRGILDDCAERDQRVRVVAAPDPDGTSGAARAAGAALSTGDYVLYLGAHDRLAPGALEKLARRIEGIAAADRPDVLLFDHQRVNWMQQATGSGDGALFVLPGREVFSARTQPEILHVTPTLANRVLRADFQDGHQDLFGMDEYAEVLPAIGGLACAERVAIIDEVLVRRVEPENPPAPTGQFNLFRQYERLWEVVDARHLPAEHRAIIFSGMIRRYLKVLAQSELTEGEQTEFFHLASEHFHRFKPAGYQRPANLNGVRHAMLERDSYSGYRALQSANRKRRNVRTLAVRTKKALAEKVKAGEYHEQLRHPIEEDLAVFSAYWDRGVACSPGAISAKLAELAPHIRQVWVTRRANVPLLPPGTDYVEPGSRRYWSVMARAKYFVNNVNFADGLVKRPGQIHVQTHHGTPLKCMGVDQIPYPATSRGVDYEALLERCQRWDFSVSSNSHSTETWERAYPVPFTSLDYGYPRNDVFYTATAADVARIRERVGIAPGRKALLYAPTHRDYEAAWEPRLDLERMARNLGEEFVLLVRGHYFYDRGLSPLERLHRMGLIIDVSNYDSVEELCLASDALITDYSSVMFDYANLDRPMVVFADDWETYSVTRGVYFDLTTEGPGVTARSQDEVERVFRSGAWQGEEAAVRRAAFRRRFCQFDDGHAAERVVRHVFLGEPNVPPVLPLERRTPAPAPGAVQAEPAPSV
ncbi:bifunctional glycosyltransferase family 2 protein/CDP-glycerol:glycerophosphate glycerophosphotransferase [Streptomyces sp. ICBB 8177]|uniref:bifunctional glycosyltransferase family 2 protein/CDP-glycerol:glycerophosphate glycerophosphotransferase n=1 Tax=Streptomyces sp. ICBB 8177 TaxID=563922 RepID=UPI000D684072|nr:bifunctional glycosyltransferase family 2 protein/CDP-glycerol:glycerophosphate glycerophosphotransferase [Streptomyces sp. ICBB 8177]PWI44173.1 CDP-glycerol--poly(glycerophosphate) glycerophosphotransferase [Streptomyces sp. ICBB 8177]